MYHASRSSAMSVFSTRDDCTICLEYGVYTEEKNGDYSLFPSQVLASYNYLWLFDDPNDFRACQEVYASPLTISIQKWEMTIKFISLIKVRVNVTVWSDQLATSLCVKPQVTFAKSFDSLTTDEYSIEGNCLLFTWCTTASMGERFGFAASINTRKAKARKEDCTHPYQLTEIDPLVIIDTSNLVVINENRLTCVFQDCPDENDCPFLVEVAVNCQEYLLDLCGKPREWTFYEVNNEVPIMENCTFWTSPTKDSSVIIQCRFIVHQQVFFRGNFVAEGETAFWSAVSIRSLRFMNDDEALFLMPDLGSSSASLNAITHRFPLQPTAYWVSLSLYSEYNKVLEQFRMAHNEGKCEYRMITGPPDAHNHHPERELITFRDEDQFIEQNLLSELYSIHVPANCSPSILITDNLAILDKHQEVCHSTVMIATYGYEDPNVIHKMSDTSLIRRITCVSYNVDMTVEIKARGAGSLTIKAFDRDNQTTGESCPTDQQPPLNCTYSDVGSILIVWVSSSAKPVTEAGCLILVHISKTRSSFHSTDIKPRDSRILTISKMAMDTYDFYHMILVIFAYIIEQNY